MPLIHSLSLGIISVFFREIPRNISGIITRISLFQRLPGIITYKDRAAPPIGGPALDDSGVKTVQWREREGHDSYQEVEV